MGLYNFEERFVPFILSGAKKHTIRATRKNVDRPGRRLHLYTGLRHKGAKLLMRPYCTRIENISIMPKQGSGALLTPRDVSVSIAGMVLGDDEKERLARADGFLNFAEMLEYWNGKLPFRGQIIYWA